MHDMAKKRNHGAMGLSKDEMQNVHGGITISFSREILVEPQALTTITPNLRRDPRPTGVVVVESTDGNG